MFLYLYFATACPLSSDLLTKILFHFHAIFLSSDAFLNQSHRNTETDLIHYSYNELREINQTTHLRKNRVPLAT